MKVPELIDWLKIQDQDGEVDLVSGQMYKDTDDEWAWRKLDLIPNTVTILVISKNNVVAGYFGEHK
jgi:hypothetical protein